MTATLIPRLSQSPGPEQQTEAHSQTDLPFVSTLSHATADPFRLLVEAVKDYGIFMLDPVGNISSWNPGAEKSKGYTAQEILGQHFSCFYTAEDIAAGKPQRGLQIALEEGRHEEEGIRLRKGGIPFWAIATITDIHDAFGQHVGYANVTRDITERKHAEEMLRLRDRAIESLVQALCITDPLDSENPIIYVNESFVRITGYSREDVIGRNCRFLQGPKSDSATVGRIRSAIAEGRSCVEEVLNYRKDGSTFWNGLSISPIREAAGKITNFVGVQTDISQTKMLEQQFYQAQKMEAIGQLASGVAHDFNNLLTIISGYSELLLDMLPLKDPKRESVKAIAEAGDRASGLTRQLLTFSRKSVQETTILDLNGVVRDAEKLLRRMIGENVSLVTALDSHICKVKVDAGQMGQVLMNLAINARDAMPNGGMLTIETSEIELDEDYAAHHLGCRPGRYVKLSVSDNGSGITADIKQHIFEPFFTTKEPSKGTGLGLATVFGIVKQNGGTINLYSEPGFGTSFKIYLPAVDDANLSSDHQRRETTAAGGGETILIVEDEAAVRGIAQLVLQAKGYTVLHAENGDHALAVVESFAGPIDLLITDVVMPGMSGRNLAETLAARLPNLKILYVSGYTNDSIFRHGVLEGDAAFLQKPYSPFLLTRKVRDVLDFKPADVDGKQAGS